MPTRPSPRSERLGTPKTPAIRFTRDLVFEASLVRQLLRAVRLLAPLDGSDQVSLATGGFYIQASDGSVTLPAAGYDYNSTGLLCWRDFHPQEWQLASPHQIRKGLYMEGADIPISCPGLVLKGQSAPARYGAPSLAEIAQRIQALKAAARQ